MLTVMREFEVVAVSFSATASLISTLGTNRYLGKFHIKRGGLRQKSKDGTAEGGGEGERQYRILAFALRNHSHMNTAKNAEF